MKRSEQIYNKVIEAMQEADEIEGIDNHKKYQELMQRIEHIARERFYNSVDLERDTQQKFISIEEMTSRLVGYEHDFLINNKEYLYDMLRDGFKGFNNYSDEQIVKAHIDKFGKD